MKGKLQSSVYHVEKVQVARFLMEHANRTILELFMAQELSVTGAAALLNLPFNRTYWQVQRLLRLGLLSVSRVEQRVGRPIRHYRMVCDEFFIPQDLVSVEEVVGQTNIELTHSLNFSLVRALQDEIGRDGGTHIRRRPDGKLALRLVPALGQEPGQSAHPPVLHGIWYQWALDFEDARNLQQDMLKLAARYGRRQGSRKYIVHLALVPLHER
ncbi:hypothetical protein [Deinococcus sp.]|uniref:hypothetical protein n=1 Tax=Deinococcus sp. TaxID=47478 RepID=UPI003C7AFF04